MNLGLIILWLVSQAPAAELPCPRRLAEDLAQLSEARSRLRDSTQDPEEAWAELWAYKALVDFDPAERDWLVAYAKVHGYPVSSTINLRPDFGAEELRAKLQNLALAHTQKPALVVLNLDRSFGYQLRGSDRNVVDFLGSVHKYSALRFVIYSPWENSITRSLVSNSGVPLRE